MSRETDVGQHTSNDNGIISDELFKAYQELIRESIASDPGGGTYVVDELSHAVHVGTAFTVSNTGTIAPAATISMLGRTGAKEVHFHGFQIAASDGNMSVHMYEAPTVTAEGTPIAIIARNRISDILPTHSVFAAPTVTDVGIMLEHSHVFSTGSQGSHLAGGAGALSEDWLFKPNTDYLIQITNDGSVDLDFLAKFVWSED